MTEDWKDDDVEEEACAIRWAIRISAGVHKKIEYSKWHWTEDGGSTLCGCYIPLEGILNFPETHESSDTVTCKRCKLKLKKEVENE